MEDAYKKCPDSEDIVLKNVSRAMLTMLRQDPALMSTPSANFTHAIDSRFRTDIQFDEKTLQDIIALADFGACTEVMTMVITVFFLNSIIIEDSTDILRSKGFFYLRHKWRWQQYTPINMVEKTERVLLIAKEAHGYFAVQAL